MFRLHAHSRKLSLTRLASFSGRKNALSSVGAMLGGVGEAMSAPNSVLQLARFSTTRRSKDKSERNEGYVAKEAADIDKLLRYHPLDPADEKKYLSAFDDDFEGRPEKDDDTDAYLPSGDPDPRHKVGKALLSLGKVHYRHADTLPEWFLERQNEICQYRTNPQIRRCLKDWMIKHDRDLLEKYRKRSLQWGHKISTKDKADDIKVYGPEETIAYANYYMPSRFGLLNRVFTELQKLAPEFVPRRTVDFGCGPATAAAALAEVWGESAERYTGVDISQAMLDAAKIMTRDKIRDCTFYSSNSEIMRRAATSGERFDLAVASYALGELPNDPSKRIATQMLFELLDVGGYLVILEPGNPMGSHTARTARQFVLDIFNNVDKSGRTAPEVVSSTFFKPEERVGKKGKKLFGKMGENEDDEGSEGEEDDDSDLELNDRNSLPNARRGSKKTAKEDRYQQIDMMLAAPKQGGFAYDQLGAHVIAPCTHDRPCPMSAGTWCSFSQKVYSGVIRKASEEKFSYVIIQKRPKPSATTTSTTASTSTSTSTGNKRAAATTSTTAATPAASYGKWVEAPPVPTYASLAEAAQGGDSPDPTPLTVLERFLGAENEVVPKLVDQLIDEVDWEEYEPPLHREEWGRIVRSPIKSKGHITMDLCTPEGRLLRNTVAKSNMHHIPSLYTALRKTTWGGLFPVLSGSTEQSAVTKVSKGSHFRGGNESQFTDDGDEDYENDERFASLRRPSGGSAGGAGTAGGRPPSAARKGKDASGGLKDSEYIYIPAAGARKNKGEFAAAAASAAKGMSPNRGRALPELQDAGSRYATAAEVEASSRSDRYRQLMEAKERSLQQRGGKTGSTAEVEEEVVEEATQQKTGGRRGRQAILRSSLDKIRQRRGLNAAGAETAAE